MEWDATKRGQYCSHLTKCLTKKETPVSNRVQLRIKKIIICFGQKTLATIYRIKNENVTIFAFSHSSYHAD